MLGEHSALSEPTNSKRHCVTFGVRVMRNAVSSQVAKRKAVAAAKQRAIRVSGTRYGGRQLLHLVYVDGNPYVVTPPQLTALRAGDTLQDMDLQPVADENEPFEGYP